MNHNEPKMDEHSLTVVLQEIADELKQAKMFMESQERTLSKREMLMAEKDKLLESLIKRFEEKYKAIQVVAPRPDTSQVEQLLSAGLDRLSTVFEKGPKPISRTWRFALFPETNTEHYYKIVFGRLIPWSFALIASWFVFSTGKDALISYREHEYNLEGNTCIKAWNDVYVRGSKLRRKEMDAAWEQAEKEN